MIIKILFIILFVFLISFSLSLPWFKQENEKINEMFFKDKDEDDFRNKP